MRGPDTGSWSEAQPRKNISSKRFANGEARALPGFANREWRPGDRALVRAANPAGIDGENQPKRLGQPLIIDDFNGTRDKGHGTNRSVLEAAEVVVAAEKGPTRLNPAAALGEGQDSHTSR